MLDNSPFVRAAVNKPTTTYIATLLQVAPIHLYGLLFCAVVALYLVTGAIYNLCAYTWNNIPPFAGNRLHGSRKFDSYFLFL